ncbi:hypothetical protein RHMOL_Rhmol10G0208100 [Rhododendron molle]|uniref:Uncharacterized protein n=1 Tax=Rhododendron molle TaxID=49168 RepID=A0ACC0M4P1_RHOML|nr:hypothetical protein RHMOL_Rhmol10G0208100 [Rhododendron molle]
MAEISNKKLIVEVCNKKLIVDSQRPRTKTIFRDLNPWWDEELEFSVHNDAESLATETLELNLYNDKNGIIPYISHTYTWVYPTKKTTGKRSTFLGKVKINGTSFSTSEPIDLVWSEEDQITPLLPLPEEQKLSEAAPPPPSAAAAEEEKQPEG